MSESVEPLELPVDFDPECHLIRRETETGVYHESRRGAALAAKLVANGTPQDLALAKKVLTAVLACQERDERDPHVGNFYWMAEDEVVEDLNAVEFNLEHLTPMMIRHGDRLPSLLRDRVLAAIRLGLDEIQRLDVLVAYSNIAVLDILNSCLGGELLGDTRIAQRGYHKLIAWIAFTDVHGIPFEYNSPTYSAVIVRALKRLADLTVHDETRIRAQTAAARLGLSIALHIHPLTGRWAGPHSRAYQPTVSCATPPERESVDRWLTDGTLPRWIENVLRHRPKTLQVTETAFAERNMGITTYHSTSFALGVSASAFGGQANVMMVHYARPGADRAGVLYTRYLIDDKWLGDFYHATDRTKSRNLIEEGRFCGVQDGPRAIALYTPGRLGSISSAKAACIWTGADLVDEVWIGDRRVQSLPVEVPPGEVVVVSSGSTYVAILPLDRTAMGRHGPATLVERGGDLVLELYNYSGAKKRFWEQNWPGAFYQGTPQCGFYLEVAEREDHADGRAFGECVRKARIEDTTEAPFVYAGERERLWTVKVERDGHTLGIEVDVMAWALKRRWTERGDMDWPMLESAVARETRSGYVAVGQASLSCGPEAAWLYACPESKCWVAAYHGIRPAPLTLVVPGGQVEIEAMATGTVTWQDGKVTVNAVGLQGTPKIIQN